MTCAPSEDSDQTGHPSSLIRVFAVCSLGSLGHADREDSDQTRWMPSLIRVFAWGTDHFVGFGMLWLFLIFWNSLTFLEEEKKNLPTDRTFSRVRGNKDIFKGGPDIAMQHQFSKLKAV